MTEFDATLAPVRARRVVIVGYGNQGRAHALNLRDSGVEVLIATRNPARAEADGFPVRPLAEAAAAADIVGLLTPDESQATLYTEWLAPHMRAGAALLFAHGLAIRFELIVPRPDLDVILVAPKGPGTALRESYLAGGGLVSLVAVHQDATGDAERIARAYAAALGSARAGIVATTFAEECEADLFNEAAVIWGAVPALIRAGWETLVEAGISPEVATFECVAELKLLADLVAARGLAGMREAISNTAETNAMLGGPRIVTAETRAEMRRILADVRSGAFTRALVEDAAAGYPRLRADRRAAARHPIEAQPKAR